MYERLLSCIEDDEDNNIGGSTFGWVIVGATALPCPLEHIAALPAGTYRCLARWNISLPCPLEYINGLHGPGIYQWASRAWNISMGFTGLEYINGLHGQGRAVAPTITRPKDVL